MIGEILGIFTSGAAGGILGTVGSLFKQRQERKTLAMELEHEVKMAEIGIRERAEEAKFTAQVAEIQADEAMEVANMNAFSESHKAASELSKYTPSWVNGIRALMRPTITMILLVQQLFLVGGAITGVQLVENNDYITPEMVYTSVESMSFLCNMAVSWWFGSRSSSAK